MKIGDIVTTIAGLVSPPIVVGLLPITLTTATVMAFVLFILRKGWWGYRGMISAAVFTVLAFWALRGLLTGAFTAAWFSFESPANVEAILWGGLVLSVVAISVLAFLIRGVRSPAMS